jgi:hypothetical protein
MVIGAVIAAARAQSGLSVAQVALALVQQGIPGASAITLTGIEAGTVQRGRRTLVACLTACSLPNNWRPSAVAIGP